MIVLEGIPGGGKTSIFTELQNRMPWSFNFIPEIIVSFNPLEDYDVEMVLENDRQKYKIAAKSNLPVIMDRSYVSSINWDYVLMKQKKRNNFKKKFSSLSALKLNGDIRPADYYLFFNISPRISIERKKLPKRSGLAWSTESSLTIAITYYFEYFREIEPKSKLLTIDASQNSNIVFFHTVSLLEKILKGTI